MKAVAGLIALLVLTDWSAPLGAEFVNRFSIASASMEPTLREGDIVAAGSGRFDCKGVTPTIGDVVVYLRPATEALGPATDTRWISRVIAGPGARVQMRKSQLYIDGQAVLAPLKETRALATRFGFDRDVEVKTETLPGGFAHLIIDFGPDGDLDNTPEVLVPEGHWFLMGDNRDDAVDSRVYGFVPAAQICGVVRRIVSTKDGRRVGLKP